MRESLHSRCSVEMMSPGISIYLFGCQSAVAMCAGCKHDVGMSIATRPAKKFLGVRATPDQHTLLVEAARRAHRSVSNFVLSAALKAAEKDSLTQFNDEEEAAIVKRAQSAFCESSDYGRDLVKELFEERRADTLRV